MRRLHKHSSVKVSTIKSSDKGETSFHSIMAKIRAANPDSSDAGVEVIPLVRIKHSRELAATAAKRLVGRLVTLVVVVGAGILLVGYMIPPDASDVESSLPSCTQDVETFLETASNAKLFCDAKVPPNECTCRNPVVAWRPPTMSKYGNWETAWKRNVELAAHVTKPLDVVLLGDSITEFWLGTSLGVPVPERGENAEAFRDLFTKKGGGHVEGLALGIAGDRCNNVIFRLQNGELPTNLNPKVWWLLIGTNDLGDDICSVESIVAGNLAIIKEIQERRPDSKIVLNSLLPRTRREDGSLDDWWERIVEINQCLKGFAQRMEGVEFFNATSIFLNDEGDIDLDLLPDRLHPSGMGARLWGKQIVKLVQQMLE